MNCTPACLWNTPPPTRHTCTCAMHSCMRERYFPWCTHFLTTQTKYLSPMQFEKVYGSVVWGRQLATIGRWKGIHFKNIWGGAYNSMTARCRCTADPNQVSSPKLYCYIHRVANVRINCMITYTLSKKN
jgi:hypothetical protein